MQRPCITCGKLTSRSYCRTCNPDRQRRRITPGRTTKAQSRFRAAVLQAAGYRCQAIENGQRCTVTDHLEAHHLDPLRTSASYNPADGVALCLHHHRLAEVRARTSNLDAAAR